jgi:hypothetical protein
MPRYSRSPADKGPTLRRKSSQQPASNQTTAMRDYPACFEAVDNAAGITGAALAGADSCCPPTRSWRRRHYRVAVSVVYRSHLTELRRVGIRRRVIIGVSP